MTAFQYVSANTPNRADYIIEENEEEHDENTAQSDLIALALNAVFLDKGELQKFSFSNESCAALKNLA